MDFKTIIFECDEDIAVLKINRPKQYNALSEAVLKELSEALDIIDNDENIKVFIITGAGEKAFISGADINGLNGLSPANAVKYMLYGHDIFSRIENSTKPSIAAVNGYALGGGCELACACDIRIASVNAQYGQPEINLGNMPGWGGTQRLTRLVGLAKAKEIVLTGDFITGEESVKIGLSNHVVLPDELMDTAFKMAKKIANKGSLSVFYAKQAIQHSLETSLKAGTALEAFGVGLCFATGDQKEGVNAFLEKRKPNFKGE